MKAIIFGHSGQDGHYLSKILRENDVEVIGISRSTYDVKVDLFSYQEVYSAISKIKPNYIFHLAATSITKHGFLNQNFDSITIGAKNILESVYQTGIEAKIFISGSGLQFINKDKPIKETDHFEARDAYSLCRIQSVYTARYYRNLGVKVYVGYFFNHDSPLRSENHMTQKIVQAANRISNGSNEKLYIGDLEAKKEYGFAGDIMNGVWKLVIQDKIYEATIGTGIGYSIQEWLEICFSNHNLDWVDFIMLSSDYQSPYRRLICDNTTIKKLGWGIKIDIQSLFEMMNEQK